MFGGLFQWGCCCWCGRTPGANRRGLMDYQTASKGSGGRYQGDRTLHPCCCFLGCVCGRRSLTVQICCQPKTKRNLIKRKIDLFTQTFTVSNCAPSSIIIKRFSWSFKWAVTMCFGTGSNSYSSLVSFNFRFFPMLLLYKMLLCFQNSKFYAWRLKPHVPNLKTSVLLIWKFSTVAKLYGGTIEL